MPTPSWSRSPTQTSSHGVLFGHISRSGKDQRTRRREEGDLTKRVSVFVEPSRHVWYPDVFRRRVTSPEQTFSIASAVTSDKASRLYGDIDVLQPFLWSSTWRAPWMPTSVITICLVGVVAESVTAQSERRSSLRCLIMARVVGRRSVNSSHMFHIPPCLILLPAVFIRNTCCLFTA